MSRWLCVTAFCFAPWIVGCGASSPLQPGLANAPRLGGTGLADERVSDVISNGNDSCARSTGPGPLRGRIPPCPTTHPTRWGNVAPSSATGASESLVIPWVEHFYSGWPCPHATSSAVASTKTPPAWLAPPLDPAVACLLPQ
ncbi:MAG: hypothetical protein ABSE49_16900 [Polyangiaceae bacterium]|jgi:hypothetical protein